MENASAKEKTPQQSSSSTIEAGIYCIKTTLNLEKVIVTKPGTDTRLAMLNNSEINEIVITSDKDFNSVHLAGDTLNSFFRIYNKDYFNVVKVTEYKSRNFEDPTKYYDGPFSFDRFLLLSERPTVLGTRKFYVKMVTSQSTLLDSVEIDLF